MATMTAETIVFNPPNEKLELEEDLRRESGSSREFCLLVFRAGMQHAICKRRAAGAAQPGPLCLGVRSLVDVFCISQFSSYLLARNETPSTKEPVCRHDNSNGIAREQIFAK